MQCPKCGGAMWDNRETKKNPRQPDFKCKNKSCDEAMWLDKGQLKQSTKATADTTATSGPVGLTPPQQASARQSIRQTYAITMGYVAGFMAKIATENKLPLDMGHVQAATFSIYNMMDKRGLLPVHTKSPETAAPVPKREPEPPRPVPPRPRNDDTDFENYPEALRDEPDDLPF